MDQEKQMEATPMQCCNGCGFYAGAGTEGLCSVCYKDAIKKKQQPPTNMPASLTPAPGSMASLSIDESSAASQSASVETGSPTVILPSQTDKRSESEMGAVGGAGASSSSTTSGSSPDSPASAAAACAAAGEDCPSPSAGSSQDQDGLKEGKKKKNRCLSCKKKVGLTGFTCRCGGLFCSIHRYSDKHECNFDYKELGQEEIRKSNPVIVAKKVQKI